MTSYYTTPVGLSERVIGSDLIILGRVKRLLDSRTEYFEEHAFTQVSYLMEVEEIIKGETALKEIRVELPGDNQLAEGQSFVLFLLQDVGKDVPDDQFVPYFGSVFPVMAKGSVDLHSPVTGLTAVSALPEAVRQVTLKDLRTMVRKQFEERATYKGLELELEPQARTWLEFDSPREMPEGEAGGGTLAEVLPPVPSDDPDKLNAR